MKKDKLLTYKTRNLVKNLGRIYPEVDHDVEFAESNSNMAINFLKSLRPKQNAAKRIFRRFVLNCTSFVSNLLALLFRKKRNPVPYL